jgi:hypothetical protein
MAEPERMVRAPETPEALSRRMIERIRMGREEEAVALLAQGANPDWRDESRATP